LYVRTVLTPDPAARLLSSLLLSPFNFRTHLEVLRETFFKNGRFLHTTDFTSKLPPPPLLSYTSKICTQLDGQDPKLPANFGTIRIKGKAIPVIQSFN
jgi:hypothetical protein